MNYTKKTFTLPVASNRVTDEQYAIAVGKRECAAIQPARTAVVSCPMPRKKAAK